MSPEEIREALATWSHARGGVWYFPPWVNTLAEAARAYADLFETGQEIDWREYALKPGRYLVVRLEDSE